jgi:hypothetical protein
VRRLLAFALVLALAGCGDAPPPAERPEQPAQFKEPAEERLPARPDGRWLVARVEQPTQLRARPQGKVLARIGRRTEFGSPRVLGVVGRRRGWLKVVATERPNGRHGWIPAAGARLYGTDFSIHVDRSERRLVLREGDRAVQRMTIAVGRPDTPTPVGRYAVTDKLEPARGDSPYGCCLLALSGHQTRLLEGWIGGDRLAIHATPSTWTVGEAASLGCMRGHTRQVRRLMARVPLGTPVFVRA